MTTTFLTIAEATKKTGRSASTVRRLIHSLTESDKHPDRNAIQPSPAEVNAFKKKGDTFTWRVREDVLMKEFGSAPVQEKKTEKVSSPDVLSILQKELDLKSQQIEKQWEVIQALNDRLREGNILMGSLQKRLALPESPTPSEPIVEAAVTEAVKKVSAKTVKEQVEAVKKKKGILAWFGR